jgi:hypothetical protein
LVEISDWPECHSNEQKTYTNHRDRSFSHVFLLGIFAKITKFVEGESYITASHVPRIVYEVRKALARQGMTQAVENLNKSLLEEFNNKFGYMFEKLDNFYLFAAAMDPLYGDLFFLEDSEARDTVWGNLKAEIKLNKFNGADDDDMDSIMDQIDRIRKKFEAESASIRDLSRSKDFKDPILTSYKYDSFDWWKKWEAKFGPLCANYARMYLCRPATSCSSERAFKSTGIIYNEDRSRLNTSTVEKLVFIRENMPLLPVDINILSELVKKSIEKAQTTE